MKKLFLFLSFLALSTVEGFAAGPILTNSTLNGNTTIGGVGNHTVISGNVDLTNATVTGLSSSGGNVTTTGSNTLFFGTSGPTNITVTGNGTMMLTTAIGTTVQAYNANLTTYAGVSPNTSTLTANLGLYALLGSDQTFTGNNSFNGTVFLNSSAWLEVNTTTTPPRFFSAGSNNVDISFVNGVGGLGSNMAFGIEGNIEGAFTNGGFDIFNWTPGGVLHAGTVPLSHVSFGGNTTNGNVLTYVSGNSDLELQPPGGGNPWTPAATTLAGFNGTSVANTYPFVAATINTTLGSLATLNTATVSVGGTGQTTLTANDLLVGNGTNGVISLATANNGILITSGAGAPSISSTLPSAVQTNITSLGTVTAGSFPPANIANGSLGLGVLATNGTVADNGNIITGHDLINYTPQINTNTDASGTLYIFSQTGNTTPLLTEGGNINTDFPIATNSTFSVYGSFSTYSTGNYGSENKMTLAANTAASVLGIQHGGALSFSVIDFWSSDANLSTVTPQGVGGIVGYSSANETIDANQPYHGRMVLVSQPIFTQSSGFALPTSGMGETWIGHEGIPGLSGNSYSSKEGVLLGRDGGFYWTDFNGDKRMYETPTTNVAVNMEDSYSGGASNWASGANLLFVVGTNAYKGGSNPGNNGGASGGVILLADQGATGVGLVAHTANDTWHNEQPGGWGLQGDGNGTVGVGGSRLQIQIGGDNTSNVVANITSSSLLLGPVSTVNETINGTITTAAGAAYNLGTSSNISASGLTSLSLTKQLKITVAGTDYYLPAATSAQ